VEVYAGDVDAFDPDPDRDVKKAAKEHQAFLKMKENFSEFPEMLELIEQYEKREDEESKFVYALDKVVAPINIYLDGGRNWKERGIGFDLDTVITNKRLKVAGQQDVANLFEQFVKVIEKEPHLFSKTGQDEQI
jgi:hypothetical protein